MRWIFPKFCSELVIWFASYDYRYICIYTEFPLVSHMHAFISIKKRKRFEEFHHGTSNHPSQSTHPPHTHQAIICFLKYSIHDHSPSLYHYHYLYQSHSGLSLQQPLAKRLRHQPADQFPSPSLSSSSRTCMLECFVTARPMCVIQSSLAFSVSANTKNVSFRSLISRAFLLLALISADYKD